MTVDVVYIDDEPILCRVFKRILEEEGLSVVTFTDAHAAIAYLREHRVGVIVCDYRMPTMSGLQLLDQLDEHVPPFLLVSGDLGVAPLVQGSRVTAVLAKPFQPEALLERVRAIIRPRGSAVD